MSLCGIQRVKITVGEDKEFKVFLREEESGNPIDLSVYTGGTINFCNSQDVKITKIVPIPGANPASGEIAVTLTPLETAQFDKGMNDMQLELTDATKLRIIVLENKLEVTEQLC